MTAEETRVKIEKIEPGLLVANCRSHEATGHPCYASVFDGAGPLVLLEKMRARCAKREAAWAARPLSVRVAQALGATVRDESTYNCEGQCIRAASDDGAFPGVKNVGHDHARWMFWKPYEWEPDSGAWAIVPPYGEDSPEGWACTGPLLVKYGIGIAPTVQLISDPEYPTNMGSNWCALEPITKTVGIADGKLPLRAACEVLLKLAAAGRLPK